VEFAVGCSGSGILALAAAEAFFLCLV